MTAAATSSGAALRLPEELTVAHVADWAKRLFAAVDGCPAVVVSLDAAAVMEVDAAGMQLLVAVERDARLQGKHVRIDAPSTAMREAVNLLGLADDLELHEPRKSSRGRGKKP